MHSKIAILALWFPLSFILLLVNLTLLVQYSRHPTNSPLSAVSAPRPEFQLTAAGGTSQVLSATVVSADARVYLVESFLSKHKSPMAPYAETIVQEADRFGIDFRLVPAIAMCESNAGKRMPKKDEYNAFGIAVYTGQLHGKAFTSWPHAIAWVSQYIKTRFYDRGISDLRDIGAIWAPPSVENGYSWTNCVESFQNDII